MDIFMFIQSINKVAIVIFFLTGFSLIYEIYLFIKEGKENKKKHKIPALAVSGASHFQKKLHTKSANDKKYLLEKSNNLAITVLLILLIIFGIIFIIGTLFSKKQILDQTIIPTPIVEEHTVVSEGIKVYSPLWELKEKNQLRFARTGDMIIIGIKTIPEAHVTKARIRINSNTWDIADETTKFNQQFNVFYREYQIASGDASLKVEAQLYSEKEGWLEE